MEASPGQVLWQIHRRPRGTMLAWAILLGFAMALGSALLLQHLLISPDPWLSIGVGLGLGVFLVASLAHGASARIESGARLVYALRGHDSVVVDLTRVTDFRYLSSGALAGIGIVAPLEALTFVSRKGVTRRQCEDLQRHLGVVLVLEFLRPEDLDPLRAAHQTSLGH
jgi:hypothetical protein